MGFKLVRVDATEPSKVLLPLGSHFIGRGKFLDCNDHRVSRKHAELTVTADSILLKSLHQNPCFFKKKSSKETIIFCQPDSHVLSNGDQFGLIPDSYWYEVIYCLEGSPTNIAENVQINANSIEQHSNVERGNALTEEISEDTEPYDNKDEEKTNYFSNSVVSERAESPSLIPLENPSLAKEDEDDYAMLLVDLPEVMDTTATDQSVESRNQPNVSTDQPNVSTDQPEKSTGQPVESAGKLDEPIEQGGNACKRSHSQESTDSCDIKKVKTEPETSHIADGTNTLPNQSQASASNQPVKTEPGSPQDVKPGPSNDQGGSSSGNTNAPPAPQAFVKPPNNPLRERCMYGANCYRRNIQHKSSFSHPTDADWGTGAQAQCPWGLSCRKTDPRHWRDHAHPPGMHAPPPRLAGVGIRPGKIQRRQRSATPESDSGEENEDTNLIVTGKRARKPILRQGWSDSEDEDPYKTDGSDEWEPPSDLASQDFSQSQDQD